MSTHSYHAHIYKTLINIHTQTHRTFSSLITIALFFVLYRAEPLRRDAIFLGGVPPARCFVSAEPLNTRHANCTHEPWLCGVHAHTYRRPCPGQGILYVSACNLWVSVCLDMLIRHTHTHKHTYMGTTGQGDAELRDGVPDTSAPIWSVNSPKRALVGSCPRRQLLASARPRPN